MNLNKEVTQKNEIKSLKKQIVILQNEIKELKKCKNCNDTKKEYGYYFCYVCY
jgi:hypothetical protein